MMLLIFKGIHIVERHDEVAETLKKHSVLFLADDAGADWYDDIIPALETMNYSVWVNEEGHILGFDPDPSRLFPYCGTIIGINALPFKPDGTDQFKWRFDGSQFCIDASFARVQKIMEVDALLREKIKAGFVFSGKTFDLKRDSLTIWNGLVTLAQLAATAGAPFSQQVIAADNSIVTLGSSEETFAFGQAAANAVSALKLQARALKDAINLLTTEAEITAFDIENNW